jgi:hypothetical protein
MKWPAGYSLNLKPGDKQKLIRIGVFAGLFLLAKNALADIAAQVDKKKTEADMDTDKSAGQAEAIKAGVNPSGNYWMRYFDGTNTEGIFEAAKEITDLDKVNEHYQHITDDHISVYDALQSELSADDYQKFLSLATKGKTGSSYYATTREDVPANAWVISRLNTNVRKTPVYTHTWNLLNNILKTVGPNKILGVTTGKFKYDENQKILFVEFWTLNRKNERKVYYAAKSQIEILTNPQKIEREKTQGKIELEILEGVNYANPVRLVITTGTTEILGERFERMGIAPKNTILGKPLLTLDTGKKKLIKVRTIQGLVRWVDYDRTRLKDIRYE